MQYNIAESAILVFVIEQLEIAPLDGYLWCKFTVEQIFTHVSHIIIIVIIWYSIKTRQAGWELSDTFSVTHRYVYIIIYISRQSYVRLYVFYNKDTIFLTPWLAVGTNPIIFYFYVHKKSNISDWLRAHAVWMKYEYCFVLSFNRKLVIIIM